MTRIAGASAAHGATDAPGASEDAPVAYAAAASHQASHDASRGLPTSPAPGVAAALATGQPTQVQAALGGTPMTGPGVRLQYASPPRPVFSTSFKGVLPPLTDYRRIGLTDLHTYSFYALMPVATFVVRALLHPFSVVKTRMMANRMPMQVINPAAVAASAAAAGAGAATPASLPGSGTGTATASSAYPYATLRSSITHIMRTEGVRGLYSGFLVAVTSVAVGPVYMFTLMHTKEALQSMQRDRLRDTNSGGSPRSTDQLAALVSPFIPGAVASCVAQCFGVPLDVITNKQMYGKWTYEGAMGQPTKKKNAAQIAQTVWRKQGIKGFYKGYFLTLLHNAPMSALVWGCFETLHPITRRAHKTLRKALRGSTEQTAEQAQQHPRLHPSLIKWDFTELALVGISAGTASAIAATLTLPLDVIKTRLQTSRDPAANVRSTWRGLLAERGRAGLFAGLSARLASTVPTSALLMICFEALKRATIREDCEPNVPLLMQQRQQAKAQQQQQRQQQQQEQQQREQ